VRCLERVLGRGASGLKLAPHPILLLKEKGKHLPNILRRMFCFEKPPLLQERAGAGYLERVWGEAF